MGVNRHWIVAVTNLTDCETVSLTLHLPIDANLHAHGVEKLWHTLPFVQVSLRKSTDTGLLPSNFVRDCCCLTLSDVQGQTLIKDYPEKQALYIKSRQKTSSAFYQKFRPGMG